MRLVVVHADAHCADLEWPTKQTQAPMAVDGAADGFADDLLDDALVRDLRDFFRMTDR